MFRLTLKKKPSPGSGIQTQIVRLLHLIWRTWWCSLLRHCVTSRKVAGLTPDGVFETLHWPKPFILTMALGSTQHLTEFSTRGLPRWEKVAGEDWQPCNLHVQMDKDPGSLNPLESSGPIWVCIGIAFIFTPHLLLLSSSSSSSIRHLQPFMSFSLLILEVPRSHTRTHHSR